MQRCTCGRRLGRVAGEGYELARLRYLPIPHPRLKCNRSSSFSGGLGPIVAAMSRRLSPICTITNMI